MRTVEIIVLDGDGDSISIGSAIPLQNLAREIVTAGANNGLSLRTEVVALKVKRTEKLIEFGIKKTEAIEITCPDNPNLYIEQYTQGIHAFINYYRRRSKEEVTLIRHERERGSGSELVNIVGFFAGIMDGALRSKIARQDAYVRVVWESVVPEAVNSPTLFMDDPGTTGIDPPPVELPPVDPPPKTPTPVDPPPKPPALVDPPPKTPTPKNPNPKDPVKPEGKKPETHTTRSPVSRQPAHKLLWISRQEAIKGAVRSFEMNGRTLTVEIPAMANEKTRILLKGQGVDKNGNPCDVEVQLSIK